MLLWLQYFVGKESFSRFFKTPYHVLAVLLCLPFIIMAPVPGSRFIYVPYFLSIFLIIPNLKTVIRARKLRVYSEKLITLVTNILILLFFGVFVFNFVETRFSQAKKSDNAQLSVMDTFYFMVVTFTTVGYGDISPTTAAGEFVIILLIFLGLAILPNLINDLLDTVRMQAAGGGSFSGSASPFVVVCGDLLQTNRTLEFINSLIRRDIEGVQSTTVVLLARSEIPKELLYAIKDYKLRGKVCYLLGSGLETEDLERVRLHKADAAFILASPAVDARLEDEANTLRAWAFDQYAPNASIFLETKLPGTAYLQEDKVTGTICLSDFKQIFLGYSALYQGFSTVLINLLKASGNPAGFDEQWKIEYGDGASNEIYKIICNPIFYGLDFATVSYYLYRQFQIIPFAMHVYVEARDTHHVVLNPGSNYTLKSGDYLFCIAQSFDAVKATLDCTKKEFDRTKSPVETFSSHTLKIVTPTPSLSRHSFKKFKRMSFVVGHPPVGLDEKSPLCILLPSPAKFEDCLLTSDVNFSDHFLVCSNNYNLFRFVCTLRSAQLQPDEIVPIVILCPALPSEQEFLRLSSFPKIYFVQGDPYVAHNLKRAGAFKAARIILTNLTNIIPSSLNSSLEDSTSIMIAHLIDKMLSEAGIVNSPIVDLNSRSNVKFLQVGSKSFTPRSRRQLKQKIVQEDEYYSTSFAAGNCIFPSGLEHVLSGAYHNPSILQLFNCFAGVRFKNDLEMDASLNLESSNLSYIAVPKEFIGKTFGSLYYALSSCLGVVPIGILRDPNYSGTHNDLPYVYTNPLYSLLMQETDFVYVLAPRSAFSE